MAAFSIFAQQHGQKNSQIQFLANDIKLEAISNLLIKFPIRWSLQANHIQLTIRYIIV